jgi:(1->4)-alpha-D-glucan 1-alpha-D-glucosylmutase
MLPSRIPSATYRLQLSRSFRFVDACQILDYLQKLGISDIYLSPILGSRKGSEHGYDVTDPTRLNPELGSEEDFDELQSEVQKRNMGLVLDLVPNHMAASMENAWWMDVLENGPESSYAGFFDINWHPAARSLDGKLLLPVLGRPFGEALDAGELKLAFQDGKFFIQYFDSSFPLAPHSYNGLLNRHIDVLKGAIGEDSPAFHEYSGILATLSSLARADRVSAETSADRRLRFESARERLWALVRTNKEVADFVEKDTLGLNRGDSESAGRMQRLLAEQFYKLAYWQNINESINYRRFFTIADLVGVRVEAPVVFDATHDYLLRLIAKGPVTGVRIDHIDGLRDPYAYLVRLRERLDPKASREHSNGYSDPYLVVEKILGRRELLLTDWPVSGTTGYDYLNQANSLFVEPSGAAQLERTYSEFIGRNQTFSEILYQKKKLVMSTLLGVEIRSLGRQLAELAVQDRYARELPRGQLIEALIEVTASLSVYRTYVRNMELPAHASKYIAEALVRARSRVTHLNPACIDFVQEVLLLQNLPHVLSDERENRLAFVMRWQQITGSILAKAMEDTALYVYHPLLSLNEVGGDPEPTQASSRNEFLSYLKIRLQNWPHSLNSTTTHDTKRSEGVRARIDVLSEVAGEWLHHANVWATQNVQHKQQVDGRPVPDRNEEYFLYQTLLGVWPMDDEPSETLVRRLQDYLVKATREAMVHTRWTRPNQKHEDALKQFVATILSSAGDEFLRDFRLFQRKIAYYGMLNSLSQVLLKIGSPGVPDFYQGSELWDFRLVDPDNRGPVDFAHRVALIEEIEQKALSDPEALVRDLISHWDDGRIKLFLIQKALRHRLENSSLYREGELILLEAKGTHAMNVVSFLRRHEGMEILVLVPRWLSQVSKPGNGCCVPDWKDTEIVLPYKSRSTWNNMFVHQTVNSQERDGRSNLSVGTLLEFFPVALFESAVK